MAWAACRALERLPVAQWQARVVASDQPRVFLMGSVGLLTMKPDAERCRAILERASGWLAAQRLSVDELVALVRIVELALDRGDLPADTAPRLREQLAAMYPTKDWRLNRELVSVLVYWQQPTLAPRLVAELASDSPQAEKIHIIMNAAFLSAGWTPELRSTVVAAAEKLRAEPGGNSYPGYLTNAATKLMKSAPEAEQLALIAGGARAPGVTIGLLRQIAGTAPGQQAALRQLDADLADNQSQPARELHKAVLIALARGDAQSSDYLRQQFEALPERRADIAQAIAVAMPDKPLTDADWQLLMRALAVVEGPASADVLRALVRSPRKDVKPGDLRRSSSWA